MQVKDLKEEAGILATLRHPNILHFYGAHFKSPNFFLVTELVEGPRGNRNLTQILRDKALQATASGDGLTWGLKLQMLRQIADAVEFLHARNIIHRDLKSSNILVTATYCCKVADFGLSRVIDEKQMGATRSSGSASEQKPSSVFASATSGSTRGAIFRNARIENRCKYQSCMVSELRIVWKQTVWWRRRLRRSFSTMMIVM